MTNSWDRPPPPSDPWGRTHHSAQQSDPWGQPTVDPVTQPWNGVPQGYRLTPPMTHPSLAPTVVVTVLLGLFGLIPATMHSARARSIGLPGGRYWTAFGITFAAIAALWIGAIVLFLSILPSSLSAFQTTSTASGPTYRPATPALPAGTIPPASTDDPTPPEPSSTDRTITSLPAGGWITVVDSLAKNERNETEAWAMANGLSRASAPVVVVDTDAVDGLTPGYWAVAVIGSTTRAEAADRCADVGRPVGGSCYPRQAG